MVCLVPHPGSEPQEAGRGQVSRSVPHPPPPALCEGAWTLLGHLCTEPGGEGRAPQGAGVGPWSSAVLPARAGVPWTTLIPSTNFLWATQFPLVPAILPPPRPSGVRFSIPSSVLVVTPPHPWVLGACLPSPAAPGWLLVYLRACLVCWSPPLHLWCTSDPGEKPVSDLCDFLGG